MVVNISDKPGRNKQKKAFPPVGHMALVKESRGFDLRVGFLYKLYQSNFFP